MFIACASEFRLETLLDSVGVIYSYFPLSDNQFWYIYNVDTLFLSPYSECYAGLCFAIMFLLDGTI